MALVATLGFCQLKTFHATTNPFSVTYIAYPEDLPSSEK